MECKYLFVLTVVFIVYLCLGAAIFQAVEQVDEKKSIDAMVIEYKSFLDDHPCLGAEDLTAFIEALLGRVAPYGGLSRAKFDLNITRSESQEKWDFAGAFTFCVTVVTTIGYGHIFPVSPMGRILCVVYALIGIPLTLLFLSGIGDQLNNIGRRIMKLKLCFQSAAVNKALNMAGVVLTGLVVMFIVPTIVFILVEDWDILKGLYYCFITLSTIGFGDYVAGNGDNIKDETWRNVYRVVVYVWILIGLAYISLIIKAISDLLIKKAEQVKKEVKKEALKLATLSSHIGAGFMEDDLEAVDGHAEAGGAPAGPKMTYRKHGIMRLLKAGEVMQKQAGPQLISVSALKEDQNEPGEKETLRDDQPEKNNRAADAQPTAAYGEDADEIEYIDKL